MTQLISIPIIVQLIAGLFIGGVLGTIHFYSLHWNTNNFLIKGRALSALLIQLARFALLSVALFYLAQWSAIALLSSLIALLVARQWVLSYCTKATP